MEKRRTGGLKMRTVARLITGYVRIALSRLSCQVFVLVLPPEVHLHQCIHYYPSPVTRKLPTRDSIISSSALARPPACQPATGLVMSWSLSCSVLPPRVALGPVRPRTESHLAQVSCGGMTRVLVQYGTVLSVRVVPVLCACMPHSPAQPSPAHFVFLPLHIPNYASPSKLCILASDHRSHHPGIRTALSPVPWRRSMFLRALTLGWCRCPSLPASDIST